jgi:hypothetical protein
MRRKHLALIALGLALALPPAANAELFVSGDFNLLGEADENPANRQLLLNLAGDGIVVLHPGEFSIYTTPHISGVLGDAAVPHFALDFDAPVTAADLLGASLYLGFQNNTGWTAAEALLLKTFVEGGGHVFLLGDNNAFADLNAAINGLTAAMGSDLFIVDDGIDEGLGAIATILTANSFTAGTDGLRYVSTSRVTGGTPLYGTADGLSPIVAFDTLAAVPEPSTWALAIIGFGFAGAALRSRQRRAPRLA